MDEYGLYSEEGFNYVLGGSPLFTETDQYDFFSNRNERKNSDIDLDYQQEQNTKTGSHTGTRNADSKTLTATEGSKNDDVATTYLNNLTDVNYLDTEENIPENEVKHEKEQESQYSNINNINGFCCQQNFGIPYMSRSHCFTSFDDYYNSCISILPEIMLNGCFITDDKSDRKTSVFNIQKIPHSQNESQKKSKKEYKNERYDEVVKTIKSAAFKTIVLDEIKINELENPNRTSIENLFKILRENFIVEARKEKNRESLGKTVIELMLYSIEVHEKILEKSHEAYETMLKSVKNDDYYRKINGIVHRINTVTNELSEIKKLNIDKIESNFSEKSQSLLNTTFKEIMDEFVKSEEAGLCREKLKNKKKKSKEYMTHFEKVLTNFGGYLSTKKIGFEFVDKCKLT